ncbi:MAG TPA: TPM domain-containing protein [Chthoniobacterales bacterium]|nr:TPM domain-containing protein [Chthoniobacterales bacterium]
MKRIALCLAAFVAIQSRAAEVIPPKPPGFFQDNAAVISKNAALRFNEQLAQFERETSNQVWVVLYPKMQSDSSIDDYTYRVKDAWKVGQKGLNNGVVLFVFVQDRKMFIQVGYGLEGALPDATCFDITEYQIKPHFRNNDYEGGLAAGIDSIFKAIRGEYKGTGKTALEKRSNAGPGLNLALFFFFVVALMIISRLMRAMGGYSYSSGRSGPVFIPMLGGGGGGWSSGGGGGFSGSLGGGGIGGGGGAGSSW